MVLSFSSSNSASSDTQISPVVSLVSSRSRDASPRARNIADASSNWRGCGSFGQERGGGGGWPPGGFSFRLHVPSVQALMECSSLRMVRQGSLESNNGQILDLRDFPFRESVASSSAKP